MNSSLSLSSTSWYWPNWEPAHSSGFILDYFLARKGCYFNRWTVSTPITQLARVNPSQNSNHLPLINRSSRPRRRFTVFRRGRTAASKGCDSLESMNSGGSLSLGKLAPAKWKPAPKGPAPFSGYIPCGKNRYFNWCTVSTPIALPLAWQPSQDSNTLPPNSRSFWVAVPKLAPTVVHVRLHRLGVMAGRAGRRLGRDDLPVEHVGLAGRLEDHRTEHALVLLPGVFHVAVAADSQLGRVGHFGA